MIWRRALAGHAGGLRLGSPLAAKLGAVLAHAQCHEQADFGAKFTLLASVQCSRARGRRSTVSCTFPFRFLKCRTVVGTYGCIIVDSDPPTVPHHSTSLRSTFHSARRPVQRLCRHLATSPPSRQLMQQPTQSRHVSSFPSSLLPHSLLLIAYSSYRGEGSSIDSGHVERGSH